MFYLTYTPAPQANPWRDLIGSAVRHWRGREFVVGKPVDLITAWSKIMSQLGRMPGARRRNRMRRRGFSSNFVYAARFSETVTPSAVRQSPVKTHRVDRAASRLCYGPLQQAIAPPRPSASIPILSSFR